MRTKKNETNQEQNKTNNKWNEDKLLKFIEKKKQIWKVV